MRLANLMLLFPITSFSDVLLVAGAASSRTATKVNNFLIISEYLGAKVQKIPNFCVKTQNFLYLCSEIATIKSIRYVQVKTSPCLCSTAYRRVMFIFVPI